MPKKPPRPILSTPSPPIFPGFKTEIVQELQQSDADALHSIADEMNEVYLVLSDIRSRLERVVTDGRGVDPHLRSHALQLRWEEYVLHWLRASRYTASVLADIDMLFTALLDLDNREPW